MAAGRVVRTLSLSGEGMFESPTRLIGWCWRADGFPHDSMMSHTGIMRDLGRRRRSAVETEQRSRFVVGDPRAIALDDHRGREIRGHVRHFLAGGEIKADDRPDAA